MADKKNSGKQTASNSSSQSKQVTSNSDLQNIANKAVKNSQQTSPSNNNSQNNRNAANTNSNSSMPPKRPQDRDTSDEVPQKKEYSGLAGNGTAFNNDTIPKERLAEKTDQEYSFSNAAKQRLSTPVSSQQQTGRTTSSGLPFDLSKGATVQAEITGRDNTPDTDVDDNSIAANPDFEKDGVTLNSENEVTRTENNNIGSPIQSRLQNLSNKAVTTPPIINTRQEAEPTTNGIQDALQRSASKAVEQQPVTTKATASPLVPNFRNAIIGDTSDDDDNDNSRFMMTPGDNNRLDDNSEERDEDIDSADTDDIGSDDFTDYQEGSRNAQTSIPDSNASDDDEDEFDDEQSTDSNEINEDIDNKNSADSAAHNAVSQLTGKKPEKDNENDNDVPEKTKAQKVAETADKVSDVAKGVKDVSKLAGKAANLAKKVPVISAPAAAVEKGAKAVEKGADAVQKGAKATSDNANKVAGGLNGGLNPSDNKSKTGKDKDGKNNKPGLDKGKSAGKKKLKRTLLLKVLPIVLIGLLLLVLLSTCSSLLSGFSSEDKTIESESGVFIPTVSIQGTLGESTSNNTSTPLGDWTYYNQIVPDWERPASEGGDDRWKKGCGVVSMAMVLTSYSHDAKWNPSYLRSIWGSLTVGVSQDVSALNARSDEFGLEFEPVNSLSSDKYWRNNWDEVKKVCDDGGCVLICAGPPLAAGTDHYVVVRAVNGDDVTIANPNPCRNDAGKEGAEQHWTKKELFDTADCKNSTNTIYCRKK